MQFHFLLLKMQRKSVKMHTNLQKDSREEKGGRERNKKMAEGLTISFFPKE